MWCSEDKNRPAKRAKCTAQTQRTPLDHPFALLLLSRALKRKEKIGDFDPPKRGSNPSFKEEWTKTKRTFYERTSFGIVQRVPESHRRAHARDPVRTGGDGKRRAGGEQRRDSYSLEIGTFCSIRWFREQRSVFFSIHGTVVYGTVDLHLVTSVRVSVVQRTL